MTFRYPALSASREQLGTFLDACRTERSMSVIFKFCPPDSLIYHSKMFLCRSYCGFLRIFHLFLPPIEGDGPQALAEMDPYMHGLGEHIPLARVPYPKCCQYWFSSRLPVLLLMPVQRRMPGRPISRIVRGPLPLS